MAMKEQPFRLPVLGRRLALRLEWAGWLEYLAAGLGILVIVILLWAPFGTKTTDVADGWMNLPLVEGRSFVSLMHGERPLVMLPWEFAVAITSDSYRGVVLVLALLFWGKAFLNFAILRRLRLAGPALAFLISVLFILYPADRGNFLMRALGRHTGVFFFLLALLFLILTAQRSGPFYWIAMLLTEAASAFMSEQGYSLILISPLLLCVLPEASKRKKAAIAASWYMVLAVAVINYLRVDKPHQERLFSEGLVTDRLSYLREIVLSNLLAFWQVFVGGWAQALEALRGMNWKYGLVALAMTLVAALVAALFLRLAPKDDNPKPDRRRLAAMILAGLALVGLSFFPYSLTGFRYVYSRVFYYAAAGAALIVGILIGVPGGLLARWQKTARTLLWGAVMFTVSLNGLAQHARFVQISQVQQRLLVELVEQAPGFKRGTAVVLIASPSVFTAVNGVWQSAINWLYQGELIRGIVCATLPDCRVPYSNAVIFEYSSQSGTRLLEELPADLQLQPGAEGYAPYKRILYTQVPRRAMIGFDVKPDPAHVGPRRWDGTGQTLGDRRVCDRAHQGLCSLVFNNDGRPTAFSQGIPISGEAGEHLVFSIWGQAARSLKKGISIASLTVLYQDGTRESFDIAGQPKKPWLKMEVEFEPSRPYAGLLVELHPNTAAGLVWFDDLLLTRNGSPVTVANPSFEK